MNVTHGMNSEEVEQLGHFLQLKADRLHQIALEINRAVYSLHWQGVMGLRFTQHEWPGQRARIDAAARGLHGFGQSALNNASEQVHASSARAGGAGGGGLRRGEVALAAILGGSFSGRSLAYFYRHVAEYEAGKPLNAALARQFPELEWALEDGHGQLLGMRGQSPEAQAAWWGHLSTEQQRALILVYPGIVAGLAGLPAAVRSGALEQYALEQRSEVASRVNRQSVEATANLGVVKLGAEASATSTQYADGHVEVTLSLTGDLGREFTTGAASGSVGVEGGVSVTYEFATAEDAQAFIDGLKDRLDPNVMESLAGDDARGFLSHYEWARQSTEASLAVTGSGQIKLGGAELHLEGSAGGTHNFDTGASTLFVEIEGGGSAGGVAGDVSGKVALTFDDHGNVTGATLSGTMEISGGASVEEVLKSVSGESLASGSASADAGSELGFSARIDPTDPRVEAQLRQLVEHPGDPAPIRELLRLSEAQISVNTTSSSSGGVEIGGSGVTTSTSTTVNQVTYVKPPGGGWVGVET